MDNRGRTSRSASIHLPSTAIASQATFAGCLAVIQVARQLLLPSLPPSVALPQIDSMTYPCLLAFGELRDGTTFFGGIPVPLGIRYLELMVAIPFVLWDGAAGEHLFIQGMVCDFGPAAWIGSVYYGFKKRLAQIRWSGERFLMADEGHRPAFHATLRPQDEAPSGTLDRIRAAAALSVLGHRSDGVFVRSRFDWDFREAAVEATSLSLALGQQFRELPTGEYSVRHDDAYRVRGMYWRLSWPTSAPSP